MYVKIFANETSTVLEALKAYKKTLDFDVRIMKEKGDWHGDRILARTEMQGETINRVIARIEDL